MLLANAVQLGRFLSDGASDALVKSVRQLAWTEWGQIAATGEPVNRNEVIARYDLGEAARTAFDMYDGEHVAMTLMIDADLDVPGDGTDERSRRSFRPRRGCDSGR